MENYLMTYEYTWCSSGYSYLSFILPVTVLLEVNTLMGIVICGNHIKEFAAYWNFLYLQQIKITVSSYICRCVWLYSWKDKSGELINKLSDMFSFHTWVIVFGSPPPVLLIIKPSQRSYVFSWNRFEPVTRAVISFCHFIWFFTKIIIMCKWFRYLFQVLVQSQTLDGCGHMSDGNQNQRLCAGHRLLCKAQGSARRRSRRMDRENARGSVLSSWYIATISVQLPF